MILHGGRIQQSTTNKSKGSRYLVTYGLINSPKWTARLPKERRDVFPMKQTEHPVITCLNVSMEHRVWTLCLGVRPACTTFFTSIITRPAWTTSSEVAKHSMHSPDRYIFIGFTCPQLQCFTRIKFHILTNKKNADMTLTSAGYCFFSNYNTSSSLGKLGHINHRKK